MNKLILFTSIFTLFSMTRCNYGGPTEGKPNWVRAVYKSDPATSLAIGWHRFTGERSDDKFYYDTIDHGEDLEAYAHKISPDKYTSHLAIRSAFVDLKNLEPETRYYFIIENTYGLSRVYYFETLPNSRDSRISIIAGGDSRNNRIPRRSANSLVRKLKPHFVMFGGDMTDTGTGNQWADWFEDWQLTIGDDGRITPVMPARGNHEYVNGILAKLFWISNHNYYALNIADGLIRTYVLNSESSTGGDQLKWLTKDFEEHQDVKWKIAQYHKPMRPHVKHKREGNSEYKNWANLFYENRVNLIVESDSHSVKSTWPIRPSLEEGNDEGFVRDDINGTVYVGEGCWGAPIRSANDPKSWTRASGKFNQFKLIFVDENEIEVRTIKIDNADEVEELDVSDRFRIPANLDVWNPASGDVLYIK